jgi:hypothetical protein
MPKNCAKLNKAFTLNSFPNCWDFVTKNAVKLRQKIHKNQVTLVAFGILFFRIQLFSIRNPPLFPVNGHTWPDRVAEELHTYFCLQPIIKVGIQKQSGCVCKHFRDYVQDLKQCDQIGRKFAVLGLFFIPLGAICFWNILPKLFWSNFSLQILPKIHLNRL